MSRLSDLKDHILYSELIKIFNDSVQYTDLIKLIKKTIDEWVTYKDHENWGLRFQSAKDYFRSSKKSLKDKKTLLAKFCMALELRLIDPSWKFNSVTDKVPYLCVEKRHNHKQQLDAFFRGVQCGKCAGYCHIDEDFIKKEWEPIGRILPDDFVYKNARTPIEFFCTDCGKQVKQSWDNYNHGYGCIGCAGMLPLTQDQKDYNKLRYHLWTMDLYRIRGELLSLDSDESYQQAGEKALYLFNIYRRNRRKWEHIDHIFPLSIFSINQTHLSNAAINLRYLTSYENWEKNKRVWFEDMLNASEEQLSILAQAAFLPKYAKDWLIELGYGYLLPDWDQKDELIS